LPVAFHVGLLACELLSKSFIEVKDCPASRSVTVVTTSFPVVMAAISAQAAAVWICGQILRRKIGRGKKGAVRLTERISLDAMLPERLLVMMSQAEIGLGSVLI
jgi:hypothetical protein